MKHPDLIVGMDRHDDAGVFRLRDDLAIVLSLDFFTPIVDDPYTFGQIAVTNALSDIYMCNGWRSYALHGYHLFPGKKDGYGDSP